ncbi:MAG TPA: hypothetical protein VEQ16_06590, partial [Acidocella sp.]|nr:hypothetical protein [Acidocella sp.]
MGASIPKSGFASPKLILVSLISVEMLPRVNGNIAAAFHGRSRLTGASPLRPPRDQNPDSLLRETPDCGLAHL